MKKLLLKTIVAASCSLCFANQSFAAATVDVYGEGKYNTTQLTVNLYADVRGDTAADNLLSGGLSLHFDPSQLQVVSGDKDQNVWYFGDPTSGTTFQYFNPIEHITTYTATDGTTMAYIPIICGKLDTRSGMALNGVSPAPDVPLGVVTFSYPVGSAMPESLTNLTIKHAKPEGDGSFKSFVTVGQVALDDVPSAVVFSSVTLAQECSLQGDITGDGRVNMADFGIIQSQWLQVAPGLQGDITGDGRVNMEDFSVVQSQWLQTCP